MDEQHRCAKEVWTGFASRGCSRRGVVQSDGQWWCKQHDPAAVARAREERRAEWERRLDSRLAATTRAALYPKLVEACRAARRVLSAEAMRAKAHNQRLVDCGANILPRRSEHSDTLAELNGILAEAERIEQETSDGQGTGS